MASVGCHYAQLNFFGLVTIVAVQSRASNRQRVGLPATSSGDWTGTLMIYITVFIAGMIVAIAVFSLLIAYIRYDEPY